MQNNLLRGALACSLFLLFAGASCPVRIVEDSSAFALDAGQATMVLGSTCSRPMALGYDTCQLRRGQNLPILRLGFLNPAEYAISDCELNIFHTGSVSEPGVVEVDLKSLTPQIEKNHFCMLRIEAIERYPDPRDKNQLRSIPLAGGFFIESLEQDFFPDPPENVVTWCYKISATTKGRRKIERCK